MNYKAKSGLKFRGKKSSDEDQKNPHPEDQKSLRVNLKAALLSPKKPFKRVAVEQPLSGFYFWPKY